MLFCTFISSLHSSCLAFVLAKPGDYRLNLNQLQVPLHRLVLRHPSWGAWVPCFRGWVVLTGKGTLWSSNTTEKCIIYVPFTGGVLFWFVSFHYDQKDRPKNVFQILDLFEWFQPQPKKTCLRKRIHHPDLLGARIFRTIKPSGRSREQRWGILWKFLSGGFCGRFWSHGGQNGKTVIYAECIDICILYTVTFSVYLV